MTAVEWQFEQFFNSFEKFNNGEYTFNEYLKRNLEIREQAKKMEMEQKGYSEEQVREMLFMALYEPEEKCCTTHTKDSIVRKVLKTFKSQ